MKILFIKWLFALILLYTIVEQQTSVPTTIHDFHLPGSQPGDSGTLEDPGKCDNCHGDYDPAVEPVHNWYGSMMAQAARDPLFYASLAIANQDAPESGDLCIRCHSPTAWLEGRSTPTDASSFTPPDREGIQCDFCHRMVKPALPGENHFPEEPDYTATTFPADQQYLSTLAEVPSNSANGMYVVDDAKIRRGPFTDPDANHQFYYSPFHKEAAFCATCHDVSNPAFEATDDGNGNTIYLPNNFGEPATDFNPYSMFPLERTYSEWLQSAYNSPEGIASDHFGGNLTRVSTCQDCHMKDVTGAGCDKAGVPIREDLPLHDMTGGNTFIPGLLKFIYPDEVDTIALQHGVERARNMLQHAATMTLNVGTYNNSITVRIQNETGHKLPTGYPEGRRMWINLKVWGTGGEYYESGHYDLATGVLTEDADAKIYESKLGIDENIAASVGHTPGPSFHFVLNNKVYKDNRIPPRGFTNANFKSVQAQPVGYTYADGQYWDETTYTVPFPPERVEAKLYYQTTSKEYIEFLRDENVTDSWGQVMYDLWDANGKSAPELMQSSEWERPCPENLNLAETRDENNVLFDVYNNILSKDTITNNANVIYSAATDIDLIEGFTVDSGAMFKAFIEGCEQDTLQE